MRRRAPRTLWAILAAAAVAACGADNPLVPAGAMLVAVSGDAQTLTVGAAAGAPLIVAVKDAAGAPLAGVPITWSVTAGGGSVSAAGPTASDGTAMAAFTAGKSSGAQIVTASVHGASGSPVTFTLAALPGAPKRLTVVGGDGQTGSGGQPLPSPLRVAVVDTFGNGVAGYLVHWTISAGGGSVNPALSTTDALGEASTVYTSGPNAGNAVIAASAGSLIGSPVAFTATVRLGVILVSEIAVPANYGQHDQFVRAGLAFLCSWNTGLQIYDVGDGRAGGSPATPHFISKIATAGGEVHNAWWYWAPNGDKRYVFVGQEGPGGIGTSSSGDIHVVDISDILAPVEVATYHLAGAGTHNFWVDEPNQILYAAYYNGGVVALNIAGTLSGDLAAREIARIQPGGAGNTYVWGVQLYGGSLYATDMLSGFWQLKLNGSAFQILGGGNNVPDRYGSDQWVANGYAYSGTWGNRAGHPGNAVKIWRLSQTGAPVLVDSIITSGIGTVSDVEVSGDNRMLMFSAENGPGAGLYFYSLVADPAHPVFIGSYNVSTNTGGIHTATFAEIGGRRYVFAARDPALPSMMILDVTPINP